MAALLVVVDGARRAVPIRRAPRFNYTMLLGLLSRGNFAQKFFYFFLILCATFRIVFKARV